MNVRAMPLKLEVGKEYRNREDGTVKIVSRKAHPRRPFRGDDGHAYREDGGFRLALGDGKCGFDLIEEVLPEEDDRPHWLFAHLFELDGSLKPGKMEAAHG